MKLEKLLNEWLAFERGNVTLAQQQARRKATAADQQSSGRSENLHPHFRVEVDKEEQVHIKCLRGKEVLAMIGLNLPGLNSLINQGLMHKPHAMQVGALHDWVELDGAFFSFEKGNNDAAKLEQVLNERYVSAAALGQGKEVVVFPNAASATGFDIQFAAKVGGVIDHRRRPLNEESLGLLQDRERCGLLPKELVIKLSPPNLVFKVKTPDGGERYLDEGPENVVKVVNDEGEVKMVDLSRPVSYLRLTALDLTAVFNHPAINHHSKTSPQPSGEGDKPKPSQVAAPPTVNQPVRLRVTLPQPKVVTKPVEAPGRQPEPSLVAAPTEPAAPWSGTGGAVGQGTQVVRAQPNLWLKSILHSPSIRPEWFTCLVYSKMAEYFGNSSEGYFGPIPCWASSLGEVDDICDPGFRGIFLTQRGGLGYLNQGHIARFHHEVAFLGTLESAIEGIGVGLVATVLDSLQRIVFVVTEDYPAKFGIPELSVAEELTRLREYGAVVMSIHEVLHSPEPMEVVWTVPAEQADPDDPQVVETPRPETAVAEQGSV